MYIDYLLFRFRFTRGIGWCLKETDDFFFSRCNPWRFHIKLEEFGLLKEIDVQNIKPNSFQMARKYTTKKYGRAPFIEIQMQQVFTKFQQSSCEPMSDNFNDLTRRISTLETADAPSNTFVKPYRRQDVHLEDGATGGTRDIMSPAYGHYSSPPACTGTAGPYPPATRFGDNFGLMQKEGSDYLHLNAYQVRETRGEKTISYKEGLDTSESSPTTGDVETIPAYRVARPRFERTPAGAARGERDIMSPGYGMYSSKPSSTSVSSETTGAYLPTTRFRRTFVPIQKERPDYAHLKVGATPVTKNNFYKQEVAASSSFSTAADEENIQSRATTSLFAGRPVINEQYFPQGFLLSDITLGGQRHLLFATKQQLDLLQDATVWYMDSNTTVVRSPFSTLFSISARVKKHSEVTYCPLLFVLMSRQMQQDYIEVFKGIRKSLKGKIKVECIVADCNEAMWTGFRSVFSFTIPLRGCVYQLSRALWSKAWNLGLSVDYTKRDKIYRIIRNALALPFLPAAEINQSFDKLMVKAFVEGSDKLIEWLDFLHKTWFESNTWTILNWSTFEKPFRMPRDIETWDDGRKTYTGGRFYVLVDALYHKALGADDDVRVASTMEIPESNRVARKLRELWKDYGSGILSLSELQRSAGRLYASVVTGYGF